MSNSLRLSEKWFRRALWLVAFVFASFLIGLGNTLVGDLPQVERTLEVDQFIDHAQADPLVAAIDAARKGARLAERAQAQAELKLSSARKTSDDAREAFSNWVATRQVTQRPDQDAELIARNRELDRLKDEVQIAQQAYDAQEQAALDANQAVEAARQRLEPLEAQARESMAQAERRQELRVFGYRLALTLPLLVIAGWLFARKRRSMYWPFVWGFIFFALFAFFVELVPYLPSYGGYVRYLVGVLVTVLAGRYAIVALNRYLARQKAVEALPETVRRNDLSYDLALTRLAKGVCPGCERAVDLKDPGIDFCQHCGIGLFDHCRACSTRKSAFAKFCHKCGSAAEQTRGPGAMDSPGASPAV